MAVKVSLFINQTAGSRFFMLVHGAVLKRHWHGEVRCDGCTLDDEVLDQIYRIFNIEFPPGYNGPSLSIADVVTLDDSRSYEVVSYGFKRLSFNVEGEEYTVRLPRPIIPQIKTWRTARHAANLPHSIDDFYRAHNICRACKGEGSKGEGSVAFGTAHCRACGGTGEYRQTP